MTVASGGAGSITLGTAVDGYQTFADAGVSDTNVVRYTIEDGDDWEIGTGVYTASGTTLVRTVTESSNGDAAITCSADAVIFVTIAAEDLSINAAPIWSTELPATLRLGYDGTTAKIIDGRALDDNGFPITYSWDGSNGTNYYDDNNLPPQLQSAPTINQTTGSVSVIGSSDVLDAGTFNFRLKASDGVKTAYAIISATLAFDYTTGLVGHYDADDTNSYNGSGTSWADISGNNNTAMTLGSAVVYNSSGHGGKASFDWGGTNGVIGTTNNGSGTTGTVIVVTRHNEVLSSTSSIFQSRLFVNNSDGTGSFILMGSNQGTITHATGGYPIYFLSHFDTGLTTSATKLYVDKVDKTQVNRGVGRELLYDTSAVRAKYHTLAVSSMDFSNGFSLSSSNRLYSGTGEVRAIRIYDHALTQEEVGLVHDHYADQYSSSDMQA
jgi:hypothetical protein